MQSNLKELLSSTTVTALTGDRGLFDVDKDLTIGDTLKVCIPNPHKGFFFPSVTRTITQHTTEYFQILTAKN